MQQEPTEDEEREIHRLVRFLTRPGPRFGLALAIYRDPIVAQEIRSRIEQQITDGFILRTLSLDYEDRGTDLVERMSLNSKGASALFVSGLDSLLINGAGRPDPSPALLNLNGRRDELPERLYARVVLWMSKAAHHSFRDNAWDLHEVIQTVCEFERSAILPRQVEPAVELPEWFQFTDKERALAIKSRAEALARATAGMGDSRTKADAASSAARAYLEGGWLEDGMEWLERAATAYETLGDLEHAATERLRLAEALEVRGDFDRAQYQAERSRALAAREGNTRQQALAIGRIADIWKARGELDKAVAVLRDEALPVFEYLNDPHGAAAVALKIVDSLRGSGRLDEALRMLKETVLPVFEEERDWRQHAAAMAKLADIHEARGELGRALRILQDEVLPMYEHWGATDEAAATVGKIADIYTARGEHDRARRTRTRDQLPELQRTGPGRARDFALHKLEEASRQPVVLLAFEDEGAPGLTRNLPREERAIRSALEPLVAAGRAEVVTLWNATVEQVVETFRRERLRGRIRVVHLRIRAINTPLEFTDHFRSPTVTYGAGLAEYLGQQDGLALVVLDGYQTLAQVDELRQVGVGAVVATSSAIRDDVAVDFATGLYAELAVRPLKTAFDAATAMVRAKWGADPNALVDGRLVDDVQWGAPWPWVLSCDGELRAWRLVEEELTAVQGSREEIDDRALVDALARVIHDRDTASVLLSRIGFPRQSMPKFDTALTFWTRVVDALGDGIVAHGAQRLVDDVAKMYPGNAFFAGLRATMRE